MLSVIPLVPLSAAAMIKIVDRLRAGTPIRSFDIDLPAGADGEAQSNQAYVAEAMKRPGADFKYPNDRKPYGWRVRESDVSDPALTT